MKHLIIYAIITAAILLLSACAATPGTTIQDGIIIADPTQIEDVTETTHTTTPTLESETTAPTVTDPTEDKLTTQNNAVLAAADGQHITQCISTADGYKFTSW